MTFRWIIIAAAAASLVACSPANLVKKIATPAERALGEQTIAAVQKGDFSSLSASIDPSAAGPLQAALPAMRRELPPQNATVDIVGGRFVGRLGHEGVRLAELTYAVNAPGYPAVATIDLRTVSGTAPMIVGVHVKHLKEPVGWWSGLSLSGAGAPGMFMLFAMAAALAITVLAVIRVWRSGRFRHRWWWTLGCLLGVTRIAMDWSTGHAVFQPLYFQLFSVGATKTNILGPWVFAVSVPLVAIYVLVRKRRASVRQADPETA